MKPRHIILLALTLLLSACNFTLAEDITPPPNYIPPTPAPTLVLYPAQAPSVANGAAIYVEKCAPCHGDTGLGDGEQGIQLAVTVRAFGLAEIARPASPAQYYTAVTRGNIERFMPPFASLTDQERWDVTAYVLTLHTTPEEIEKGKSLFESNCKNCSTGFFKDQERMSSLTQVELARILRQGNDQVPAFGSSLGDDDLWAVAAYLRTLSFDSAPPSTPGPASAPSTPVSAEATHVATNQASAGSEATMTLQPGFGIVSGFVENKTGDALPPDLVVTLRGFDHDPNDPNAGPVEVLSFDGRVNADGAYAFETIEMPANRIFLAEVNLDGVRLQSEFVVVEDSAQLLNIPALTLFGLTQDTTGLVMDDVQVIFDYGEDSIAVYSLYSFRNPTDEIIVVPQNENGEIPIINFPEGSFGFGIEPTQDSERFLPTENGFAIPPSDNAYGLVALSSLSKTDNLDFSQTFALPVASINVFTPAGMRIENSQMADLGVQAVQNFTYQIYQSDGVSAGEALVFTLTGHPEDAPTTTSTAANTGLLIGAGALGAALLFVGLWMVRQDRQKNQTTENPANDFDSAEEVMDAILALDDLHGKKRIPEKAYQKRRKELKEILRRELEQ